MIPILYETITEGAVPTHYGIGPLTDCLTAEVKEERNGSYELTLTYAAEGIHAEDIQPNRFIKAKPNYTDNPQIFRIYKVGKKINGKFSVNCQHISYDLSGKIITTGTASSAAAACLLLDNKAGAFDITTDISKSAAFAISEPSSVRSWFGGKAGSLLDVYGGEWKYDNYSATLKSARGLDRGVTIRYGKNLTDISQVLDMSNLCTGIIPFYIDSNGNKTIGSKVSTGLVLDVTRDKAVDFSNDVDPESSTPIWAQIQLLATSYISHNNLTTLTNSITLDFVQLEGLTERVDLCDTVHIYFEPLGITATAKCISTVWDVLQERYKKTTFGEARTNITDTIAENNKKLETAASRAYVNESSQLITGNLGGYVILNDSDGDGKPDEILIMNTDNVTTATQVWRFNKGGLGYGTSYTGPFDDIALTADGKINASRIVTGTLTANVIKAGVLSDAQGNSTIDMTNGEAVMNNFDAKNRFRLLSSNGVSKFSILHNATSGTNMTFVGENGLDQIYIHSSTDYGGQIALNNKNGKEITTLGPTTNLGGLFTLKDTNAKLMLEAGNTGGYGYLSIFSTSTQLAGIFGNSTYGGGVNVRTASGTTTGWLEGNTGGNGGTLTLANTSGSVNIQAKGQNGNITCVSVTQTSSRKVKENIEPIKDAEKILELEAVEFDFKNKTLGTDKRGFIAEDVAKVLPNLVSEETEDKPASLDYLQMIPYLQAVIKEQDKRIKALEDKINKLEG